MTEAILAGEQVKKLALQQGFAVFTAPFTVFPGLAEHFFVGDGPRHTGNGNRQQKQPGNLGR